jgi:hypothetical protein
MKVKTFLALAITGLLSVGIASAGKDETVVVFSADQAKGLALEDAGPYWTPTAQQIEKLESRLAAYLAANPPQDGHPVINILEYGRQYVGVTRAGKKAIFLNAFCPSYLSLAKDKSWLKELVQVEDGGSCFFQVYFDPESSEFSALLYNGVA